MKNLLQKNIRIWLTLLLILTLGYTGYGAYTETVTLQNCSSTSTTLTFDLFLTNTNAGQDTLNAIQIGIDYNFAGIANGGTLSIAYVAGTSQLNNNQNAFIAANTFLGAGAPYSIRLTAQPVLSEGNGTIFPAGASLRVGTFTLTNTNLWTGNSTPNFVFVVTVQSNKTQTKGVFIKMVQSP